MPDGQSLINWDGYGYFAYLPGWIVYGDVEAYAFADEMVARYGIGGDLYQLKAIEGGGRFPIYNIGLSVLWAPAYLLAHGLVRITAWAPADGHSWPYQWAILLTGWAFVVAGYWFLRRFLLEYFPDRVVALTVFGVGLATNLFHYWTVGIDITHGYLFALYAIFAYYFARYVRQPARRDLLRLGLLAGIMCLIRSSEIVVFALPALYGLRNWWTFKRNLSRTVVIFLVALAVFSIQLVYYRYATGQWWRNGYEGLGFDWLAPHIREGLFSYRRGWLLYTPIMVFALLGLVRLPFVRDKPSLRRWALPLVIFLLGNVYILFSWHIWYYGDTFGSRPVTQSYALLALPLATSVAWAVGSLGRRSAGTATGTKRAGFRTFVVGATVVTLAALNLFQIWQYTERIIPLDFTTRTYYWHVFGKTELDEHDRVYLDTDARITGRIQSAYLLFTREEPTLAPPYATAEYTSLLPTTQLPAFPANTEVWVRTKLVYSYYGDTFDKWNFVHLATELRPGADDQKWSSVNVSRATADPHLDSLVIDHPLQDAGAGDGLRQYIWNTAADSVLVRQYEVSLLFVD